MSRDRSGAAWRWLPAGADMDGADIMNEPLFLLLLLGTHLK